MGVDPGDHRVSGRFEEHVSHAELHRRPEAAARHLNIRGPIQGVTLWIDSTDLPCAGRRTVRLFVFFISCRKCQNLNLVTNSKVSKIRMVEFQTELPRCPLHDAD